MKILITGAHGLLGTKLMKILSKKFDVIGTDIKDSDYQLDISIKKKVIVLFNKIKPDIIIHCAAYTDVDGCEINKKQAYNVNVIGTKNIAKASELINAKLMYISTDFVFDGKKGNYNEKDKPNPLSYYAQTKYEGEKFVREHPNHLIARSSVLYGYNHENDNFNFTKWIIDSLKEGKQLRIVTDQINSPTLIDDIAYALIKLFDKNGIYNVVGPEAMSRYGFAVKIAEVFGFDKKLITPITSKEFPQKAVRPKDVSLDISKIKKLGIKMSNVKKGAMKIKKQMREK